jgi:CubicO group peptidase (beta-lactamase class C family)
MKPGQFFLRALLPAFLFFSCGENKTQDVGAVENYPTSQLTDSVKKQFTSLVDNNYLKEDSGMVAMAVYLKRGDELLVDTTYFFSNNNHPLPNDSTVFQMGSVTKTFTAALIARQVNQGNMDLNGLAQNYLPAAGTVPVPKIPDTYNGQKAGITLGQLATMNAGLARNAPVKDGSTPYLFAFKYMDKNPPLLYQPGSTCYIYSNLGFGILGLALCSQAYPNSATYYDNYEKVVVDSLLVPLAMNDTRITLNAAQLSRRAVPYDSKGNRSGYNNPNWPMNYAAGALYSTLSDMQRYAKEMIGQGSYLTKQDIDTLLQKRSFEWSDTCKAKKDHYSSQQAMAWIINNDMKDNNGAAFERFSKDGGLGGFSTYITCSTPSIKGVQYKAYVVLWANKQDFPVGANAKKVMQLAYSLLK